jgi:hypothetical protein
MPHRRGTSPIISARLYAQPVTAHRHAATSTHSHSTSPPRRYRLLLMIRHLIWLLLAILMTRWLWHADISPVMRYAFDDATWGIEIYSIFLIHEHAMHALAARFTKNTPKFHEMQFISHTARSPLKHSYRALAIYTSLCIKKLDDFMNMIYYMRLLWCTHDIYILYILIEAWCLIRTTIKWWYIIENTDYYCFTPLRSPKYVPFPHAPRYRMFKCHPGKIATDLSLAATASGRTVPIYQYKLHEAPRL